MDKCRVLAATDEISEERWHALRRLGLGGSDASAVMGVNPWKSSYALWAEKSGRVEPSAAGPAAQWGNDLELAVARRFAKEAKCAVVAWPVILQSRAHEILLANVDFFIVATSEEFPASRVTILRGLDPEPAGILSILEVKTTGVVSRGNPRGWADGQVPIGYEYQGLHYCAVTGQREVVFACLVGGSGLVIRRRSYEEIAVEHLIEAEEEFWRGVREGYEPGITGLPSDFETLKAIYPESAPGSVVYLDDFAADLVGEYREAQRSVARAEEHLNMLKARLERLIGDSESAEFNGRTLYTFRTTAPREAFDHRALQREMPEIWEKFATVKPGYRVLRIVGEES